MAAPPLLPSDWQNLIPKAGEERCSAVAKVFLQIPLALFRTAEWAMNADGTASEEFKAWVGTGTTGGSIIPQNVTATTNQNDQITVNWNLVASARSYSVSRSLTNDTGTMVAVATGVTGVNYWVDTGVDPGTTYYYAVQAVTTEQTSGFSNIAQGLALEETPGAETLRVYGGTAPSEFPVPAGFTLVDIHLWGGGGRGGAMSNTGYSGQLAGGGGGASGAYVIKTDVAVLAGDVFLLNAAAGATSGAAGTSSVAILQRGGTNYEFSLVGNDGMNGGDSFFAGGVQGGVGGTPAPVNPVDSMPSGDPFTHTLGAAGTAGTRTGGGAGGAAISGINGNSGGAGGNGYFGDIGKRLPGMNGFVVLRFHS